MPIKISNLGRRNVASMSIDFGEAGDLNNEYYPDQITLRLSKRVQAAKDTDVPGIFFSVIKSWDRQDDGDRRDRLRILRCRADHGNHRADAKRRQPKSDDLETLTWAFQSPAIFDVEVEQGRHEPLPDWVDVIHLSQHMGVPPWELIDVPKHWLDKVKIVFAAHDAAKEKGST